MNRINHLKNLVTFMSEATKELIWMNQREEPEVSRDWSSHDLDIEELQAHGEVGKHGSINVGGMRRLRGRYRMLHNEEGCLTLFLPRV